MNFFGEKLKKARIAVGMTQGKLAELVGVKGKQAVSNWEHGLSHPDLETIALLAQHLKVPVDYFFGIEEGQDVKVVTFKLDLKNELDREIYECMQEEAKKNNRSFQEELEIAFVRGFYIQTYLKKKEKSSK